MIIRLVAIGCLGVLLLAPQAWAQASSGVDVLNSSGQVINSYPPSPAATDPGAAYACVDATGKVTAVLTTRLSNYTGEKLQCDPGETLQILNFEQLGSWRGELVKQDEYLESIAPPPQQ
jgi:hypothetical protein